MPKLSDTRLVILSAAAQRDDGATWPPPESLTIRGGGVAGILESLLAKGLIVERPAALGTETWRETEGLSVVVRPGTRQALLIGLLWRDRGAAIAEIGAATGWQAHSVRGAISGAISGAIRKKLGLTVASELDAGRGWVYRFC